jgi:phosphate:Na+ symporter
VRHALQSAKGVKDVTHNLSAYLGEGGDDAARVREMGSALAADYRRISELWRNGGDSERFEKLAALIAGNRARYEDGLRTVHERLREDRMDPQEVSTALNVNREVYSSTKALLEAVGWHLLEPKSAEHLEALPAVPA